MTSIVGSPVARSKKTAIAFRDDVSPAISCLPFTVTTSQPENRGKAGAAAFRPNVLRKVMDVKSSRAGSTGTIVVVNNLDYYDSYAADLFAGGHARFYRYDGSGEFPTFGEIGQSDVISADALSGPGGYGEFEIADSFDLQPRDFLILERVIDPNESKAAINSERMAVSGLEPAHLLMRQDDDLSPNTTVEQLEDDETGEGYWRITVPAGEVSKLRRTDFGGSGNPYYNLSEAGSVFRYDVEMRRVSGSVDPTWEFVQVQSATPFPVTSEWAEYTFTFTGTAETENTSLLHNGVLGLTEGAWEVRKMVGYRDNPGDDPDLPEPEMIEALENFGASMLRTHGFIKTEKNTYRLWDLLDRNGTPGSRGQSLTVRAEMCAALGIDLWFQIEYVLTDEEQLGLMEWLAAPFDPATDTKETKPWAWKRWKLTGRTKPYTDVFDLIGEEEGNENWNNTSGFYTIPYEIGPSSAESMAAWLNRIKSVRMTSPYWEAYAAKRMCLAGGWTNMAGWTAPQLRNFPDAEVATMNLYNGTGWEQTGNVGQLLDYSEEYLARILQNVPVRWEPLFVEWQATLDEINEGREIKVRLGGYEQNHTSPVMPNPGDDPVEVAEQNRTWGSKAIQTAIVDQFCSFAAHGAVIQNYFVLGRNEMWGSHQPKGNGGAARASWLWLGLINRLGMEKVYQPRYLTALPANAEDQDGNPVPGVNQAVTYYMERGDTALIVMINRSLPGFFGAANDDGFRNMVARVPEGYANPRKWTMTGTYSDHNTTPETKDAFSLVEEVVDNPGDTLEVSVPPGDVVVFAFDLA